MEPRFRKGDVILRNETYLGKPVKRVVLAVLVEKEEYEVSPFNPYDPPTTLEMDYVEGCYELTEVSLAKRIIASYE